MRDAGHRPHARHFGEEPRTEIDRGPFNIRVTLDTWGPRENLFATLYNQLQANWGDEPERFRSDDLLAPAHWEYLERCFAGQTLQQALEAVSFMFTIDGVSRACTHQLVRTRIGAAMMQHGGRDNDWRHRNWRMPETIARACDAYDGVERSDRKHCIVSFDPLADFERCTGGMYERVRGTIEECKRLYAALVDSGIPWQDARRVLPIGLETYIHINYNWLALKGVLANRLEHVMDWETNCVAQLMLREVNRHCPPIFGRHLKSHSDRLGRSAFDGLDSWPPDKKYASQNPVSSAIPRTHRPEQNPFWVLAPSSIAGGPIEWIASNGEYPWEEVNRLGQETS